MNDKTIMKRNIAGGTKEHILQFSHPCSELSLLNILSATDFDWYVGIFYSKRSTVTFVLNSLLATFDIGKLTKFLM